MQAWCTLSQFFDIRTELQAYPDLQSSGRRPAVVKTYVWGLCNSVIQHPDQLEDGVRFILFPQPEQSDKNMRLSSWTTKCKQCLVMDISFHPCLYNGHHKNMLACTVVTTRVCLFVQWSPPEYACLYSGYHKSTLVCTMVTTRVCLLVQWSPQEYACLYNGHHKNMLACTVVTTRVCLFVQWSPPEYACTVATTRVRLFVQWSPQEYAQCLALSLQSQLCWNASISCSEYFARLASRWNVLETEFVVLIAMDTTQGCIRTTAITRLPSWHEKVNKSYFSELTVHV